MKLRTLIPALGVAIATLAVPGMAEASHRHSRSCGHHHSRSSGHYAPGYARSYYAPPPVVYYRPYYRPYYGPYYRPYYRPYCPTRPRVSFGFGFQF